MKKKNSTRLANKPAVKPAAELVKEGNKKKKDALVNLQVQAYEGVLKDLSRENFELRKEIRKRKGRQDSFSSSPIPIESRKKKTPVSLDSTMQTGISVSSSPPDSTTPAGVQTQNLQELIAEAVAKALQQAQQATTSGAASPTRALFSEEKEEENCTLIPYPGEGRDGRPR